MVGVALATGENQRALDRLHDLIVLGLACLVQPLLDLANLVDALDIRLAGKLVAQCCHVLDVLIEVCRCHHLAVGLYLTNARCMRLDVD